MGDVLKCPVCINVYRKPRILNCLHSFCLECLTKQTAKTSCETTVSCPVCQFKTDIPHTDLSQIRRNVFLENIIELKQLKIDRGGWVCQFCCLKDKSRTVKPVRMCLSCGDRLCTDCAQKHNLTRITHNHRVVPLDDVCTGKYDKELRSRQEQFCMEHQNEVLRYFCKTCNVLVCIDCVLVKHKEHLIVDPSEVVEDLKSGCRNQLETYVSDTKSLIAAKDVCHNQLEQFKQSEKNIIGNIRKARDAAINLITEEAEKAETEVINAMFSPRVTLRSRQNRLEENIIARNNIVSFCKVFLNDGNEKEILSLYDLLIEGISYGTGSKDIEVQQDAVEIPNIKLELKVVPRNLFAVRRITESENVNSAQCTTSRVSEANTKPDKTTDEKSMGNSDGKQKTVVGKSNQTVCLSKSPNEVKSPVFTDVSWFDKTSFVLADNQNHCIRVVNMTATTLWRKKIDNVYNVAVILGVVACNSTEAIRLEQMKTNFPKITYPVKKSPPPIAKAISNKDVIISFPQTQELRIYNKIGQRIGHISLQEKIDINRLTQSGDKEFYFSNRANATVGRILEGGKISFIHLPTKIHCGYDFKQPCGISADIHGNIFVAEYSNNAIVKLSPTGTFLGTLDVTIQRPLGLSIDKNNRLLVTGDNDKVWVIQL